MKQGAEPGLEHWQKSRDEHQYSHDACKNTNDVFFHAVTSYTVTFDA